jgi:hypothetical protein
VTVRSSLTNHEMKQELLPRRLSTCMQVSALARTLQAQLLCEILRRIRRPTPPELVLNFSRPFENFLRALLAENLQQRLSVEVFRPCALLQQQSFNTLLRIATLRLHLACALLARLLCLSALLEEMRTKSSLIEPFSQRTPCGQIQLHSLQESSGSLRETIETHSLTLSDFNSTMKSHTQHIKANV